MGTQLRLLMRDGALNLRFSASLTVVQYEALLKACKLADTRYELREAAKQLAIDWRSNVKIEE